MKSHKTNVLGAALKHNTWIHLLRYFSKADYMCEPTCVSSFSLLWLCSFRIRQSFLDCSALCSNSDETHINYKTTTSTQTNRANAGETMSWPCIVLDVLLLSSSAISSFCLWNGETAAWLRANDLHSNILVPWAKQRIITGPREQGRFVD